MRIASIDFFRGLSICLMVFFSIYGVLSSTPDFLQHNEPNSLHFGDFVLPLFLFASGMSLVFFAKKRESLSRPTFILDCLNRFTVLFLISMFLSPFSAGGFLGMDEVMLSAILFIPTVALFALPSRAIAAVSFLPFFLYFALASSSALPDFGAHHLGGYPAAIFYLPVMLWGALAGRRIAERKPQLPLLAASSALSALLLLISPPHKMVAGPSFMSLSISLSLALFILSDYLLKKGAAPAPGFFQYLGRKPIRYWVFMFLFLLIPINLYTFTSGTETPLELGGLQSFLISTACIMFLFLISKIADFIMLRITKKIR